MSNWKIRSDDWTIAENQNGGSLTHYGVKGMRWGVRKEPDKGSSKVMKKMAEKYKGKITRQSTPNKTYRREVVNVNDVGGVQLRTFDTYYNKNTGKYERTDLPPSVFVSHLTPDSPAAIAWEEDMRNELESDYDQVKRGSKPRTYVDADGNIWQWNDKANDYVKLGGTKGKMKETMSYKVSQIGKKIGGAVNKVVEAGKNFLTKLFNVKSGTKTTTRGTDKPKTNTKANSRTTSGINAYVPKNARLQPTKHYKDVDDWRRKNKR